MSAVARLVTVVDLADVASPSRVSLSARHEALLDDGRRLTLLDDRGWTASCRTDIWEQMSVAQIEATARVVVGPDEPFDGRSQDDMAATHWAALAGILRQNGVLIDPGALSALPHDVELSARLLDRARRAG